MDFIKQLRIRNFKSIKDVELDCERINLFIGEPNVGKSNVLEAMSLLGAGYGKFGVKFMGEFIRYEEVSDLFHFDNVLEPVEVECNLGAAFLRHLSFINSYDIIIGDKKLFKEVNAYKKLAEVEQHIVGVAKMMVSQNSATVPYYYSNFNAVGENLETNFYDLASPIKKYTFHPYSKEQNLFSQFYCPHLVETFIQS
ncbi:MAG: AAA family ATPase [Saprospiraceae bacterium]|nr:AAA family ATPase [Saprospiraceae bacterium]